MRLYLPLACAPISLLSLLAVLDLPASTGGEAFNPPLFAYYQPILDRMPFGAMPENLNATPQDLAASQLEAKSKAEQEALAKKIKMSVVNITPAGATAIGFTDLSVNPPVNHYLKVGDTSGTWRVVSADYSAGSAVIEKDGVTVELSLKEGVAVAAAAPAAETAEAKPAQETPRNGLLATSRVGAGSPRRPLAARGALPRMPERGLPHAIRPETATEPEDAAGQTNPASISYAERLRERTTQKTREQLAAEAKMREQFENLARETAAKEIQRREEEALQAAHEEAELQQQWAEQQAAEALPTPEQMPAALQEGNLE